MSLEVRFLFIRSTWPTDAIFAVIGIEPEVAKLNKIIGGPFVVILNTMLSLLCRFISSNKSKIIDYRRLVSIIVDIIQGENGLNNNYI
jgi:hypothetical protein